MCKKKKEKKVLINSNEYNYKDVVDFELQIDGTTITKTDTGSAFARTLLYGSIIGGSTAQRTNVDYCKKFQIKITVNNIEFPTEYIDFLKGSFYSRISKSSRVYKIFLKQFDEILSIFKIITK